MAEASRKKQKVVVVGAGPVGTLAAIYAAKRGDDVEVYEFRKGDDYSENCSAIFHTAPSIRKFFRSSDYD